MNVSDGCEYEEERKSLEGRSVMHEWGLSGDVLIGRWLLEDRSHVQEGT